MRLKLLKTLEAAARHGVLLDVADPAFGLALGPRPIGRAGPGLEAPMPGERQEPGVERDRTRLGVMLGDERAGVVDEDFLRNAAKCEERVSSPANQLSWRSLRKARTCSRRE